MDTAENHDWIENDGLLRDEGVLFGLAGTANTEKLEAINRYYESKIKSRQSEHDEILRQVEILKGEISTKQLEIKDFDEKLRLLKEPNDLSRFLKLWVVLFITVSFLLANYSLVYLFLKNSFESAWIIAIGVYAFGLFGFLRHEYLSSKYDHIIVEKHSVELWKLRMEEYGVSIVASFFIIAWHIESLNWYQTIALFFFCLALFLYGGKILVLLLREFQRNYNNYKLYLGEKQKQTEQMADLRKKIEILNAQIVEIEYRVKSNTDKLSEFTDIEKLKNTLEYKAKLFLSEYNLAKEYSIKHPSYVYEGGNHG